MKMQIENCSHPNFVCVRTEGTLEEVRATLPLSFVLVESVKKDPRQAELVCPHGNIQCGLCGQPLLGLANENKAIPSAATLTERLSQPRPKEEQK